jgi:hypothetical protein
VGLSRHNFLIWLAAATGVGALAPAEATLARSSRTIVKTATATRTGEYLYLPFRVHQGVHRVAVKLTKCNPETKVGVGLCDRRGPGYESPGFRGVFGEESSNSELTGPVSSRSAASTSPITTRTRLGRGSPLSPSRTAPRLTAPPPTLSRPTALSRQSATGSRCSRRARNPRPWAATSTPSRRTSAACPRPSRPPTRTPTRG